MTSSPRTDGATVELVSDPVAFLDVTGEYLAADPVLTTVVATVTQRAVADDERGAPATPGPRWWAVARDAAGTVVGAAMRTAPFEPHPLYVLPMPPEAARALVAALHRRGEDVPAVNGTLPAAELVAREAAARSGGTVRVHEHMRLFELGELVEPEPPPGRLRAATGADVDLAVTWFNAFARDAAEQAGREGEVGIGERIDHDTMAHRIEHGEFWLWEDERGQVVHLTGHNAPAYGVVRVGPVYTPRAHRGRGYASATVAGVCRRLLDAGHRVCLFTDQENLTSNKIYEAIGFRRVVDMANLVVT